jgi:hypothetical protein
VLFTPLSQTRDWKLSPDSITITSGVEEMPEPSLGSGKFKHRFQSFKVICFVRCVDSRDSMDCERINEATLEEGKWTRIFPQCGLSHPTYKYPERDAETMYHLIWKFTLSVAERGELFSQVKFFT